MKQGDLISIKIPSHNLVSFLLPCFLLCLGAFSDEADRWYNGRQAEMNGKKSGWYFTRR
jgi:hypothetical protein